MNNENKMNREMLVSNLLETNHPFSVVIEGEKVTLKSFDVTIDTNKALVGKLQPLVDQFMKFDKFEVTRTEDFFGSSNDKVGIIVTPDRIVRVMTPSLTMVKDFNLETELDLIADYIKLITKLDEDNKE